MATVRITQDVKNKINEGAKDFYAKRVDDAETFFMDKQELGELIVSSWVKSSGFAHSWLSIPPEFMFQSTRVLVHAINNIHIPPGNADNVIVMPTPIPQAPIRASMGYALTDEDLQPVVLQWVAWLENRRGVQAQAQVFKSKVSAFIDRHATLKSALSEWPQLWDIVPADLRARHNEVTERKPGKLTPRQEFDTREMTGMMVETKLVNSIT